MTEFPSNETVGRLNDARILIRFSSTEDEHASMRNMPLLRDRSDADENDAARLRQYHRLGGCQHADVHENPSVSAHALHRQYLATALGIGGRISDSARVADHPQRGTSRAQARVKLDARAAAGDAVRVHGDHHFDVVQDAGPGEELARSQEAEVGSADRGGAAVLSTTPERAQG